MLAHDFEPRLPKVVATARQRQQPGVEWSLSTERKAPQRSTDFQLDAARSDVIDPVVLPGLIYPFLTDF
jgi:hypothetical protein